MPTQDYLWVNPNNHETATESAYRFADEYFARPRRINEWRGQTFRLFRKHEWYAVKFNGQTFGVVTAKPSATLLKERQIAHES